MSGNIFSRRYSLGGYGGASEALRTMMAACKDYFDSHPGFQRIASYSGSLPSSGFDPYWGDNPMGERAFCVWRAVSASNNVNAALFPNNVPTFDVAISVAFNETTSTNPRQWKTDAGDYGLGIIMAWHQTSRSWSGTSNNNGTDTFTAGASAPFSASSIVLPRANGTSGTDATNRNGMLSIDAGNAIYNPQMFFTGDNDTISIVVKYDAVSYANVVVLGGYQRISSSYREPLFLWDGTTRGTDIGSTSTRTGGGCITTASNGNRIARIDFPRDLASTSDSVTKTNLSIDKISELPITLFQYETSHFRPAGFLNGISASFFNSQSPLFFYNGSDQRLLVKFNSNNLCLTFPWSGSTDAKVF